MAQPSQWSLRALTRSLRPDKPALPRRAGIRLALVVTLACVCTLGAVSTRSAHHRRGQPFPVITSGTAGFKKTLTGELQRWRSGEVTVSIDDSVDKRSPAARDAVERAFGTWLESDPGLPALRFDTMHQAKPTLVPDGKSTVMLAKIPFEGHTHDVAITIGFADPDTGRLVEADIVLNARYDWSVLGAANDHGDRERDDSYDVQNVATHEVGHFFGLGEDQDNPDATMFERSSKGETQKRDLETDDRTAISTLYVTPLAEDSAPRNAGCGGARIAAGTGPTQSSGWILVCLGVAACIAARRMRVTPSSRCRSGPSCDSACRSRP